MKKNTSTCMSGDMQEGWASLEETVFTLESKADCSILIASKAVQHPQHMPCTSSVAVVATMQCAYVPVQLSSTHPPVCQFPCISIAAVFREIISSAPRSSHT